MTTAPFVHLHVHSHHSLKGGLIPVESLMRRASELDMPALALTDHANLGGLVELFEAGRRFGVKPIVGCDLPLAPIAAASELAAPGPEGQGPMPEITLLAATDGGLRNLMSLHNRARTAAGRGTSGHVTLAELRERMDGLIALTGGPRSELAWLLHRGKAAEIDRHLSQLASAMGREGLFFEIIDRGDGLRSEINQRLIQIADFLGMRAVATNDVWHIEPSQALAHDFLRGEPFDPMRWIPPQRRSPPTAHFSTPGEMRERFIHRPQLLEATLEIADRCTAGLDLGRRRFPHQDFTRGLDANSALWDIVFREAPERLGPLTEKHKERLNSELDHIAQEDLANYLLLLRSLAEALDQGEVLRGVGEGRIVTSLVAHVLGLTEINPMSHGLEFSGLREAGEAWPRLGLSLATRSVPIAERHLRTICGETRVARTGELSTERPRNLRRALCQWAGLGDSQTARALSTWPKRTVSLAEAQRAWDQEAGESAVVPRAVPRMVLAHLAQAIHPRRLPPPLLGGEIIVSGVDLTQILPLQRHAESTLPVTQLDSRSLDRLGLLRINLHTLPALDIIDHATEWVRREERADFEARSIPFDDSDTWALIGRGLTTGIPGLDRITIKSDLRAIQPRTLAELIEVMEDHLPPLGEAEDDPLPPIAEAMLALRCAHLKTHHPVSFLAAMFTAQHANRQLFRVLLREATALNIRLLAPDINTSHFEFTQEGGAVRAGLMCVQGMTRHAFATIERARRSGAFQDIHDLWARVDQTALPLRLLTNLVKGGVLDSLDTRSSMLSQIGMLSRGSRRAPPGSPQTPDLFDSSEAVAEGPVQVVDDQTLSRYMRQVLGTVITQDPLAPHQDLIRRTRSISPAEIQGSDAGDEITVIGCIDHSMRASLTPDEDPSLILDLEGQVVVVPPEFSSDMSETLVHGEPFLLHGPVTRRGHERILRAHCVVPVSKVERVARAVSSVVLDLSGENKRTVKLLLTLCQQHPGATQVEVRGNPEGVSRRLIGRLAQTRVHFSPPLQFGLRKILPEDAIKVQQRGLGEVAESA